MVQRLVRSAAGLDPGLTACYDRRQQATEGKQIAHHLQG